MKGDKTSQFRRRTAPGLAFVLGLVLLAGMVLYWVVLEREDRALPSGIAVASGVLTATQVPVASPGAGAVLQGLVPPGTAVTAGTPILRLRGRTGEFLVVTPRAGRLDRLAVQPNDDIEAGRVVATLTDLADLAMIAPFPAETVGHLPIGAEARLELFGFKGNAIPARVVSVVAQDGGATAPQPADGTAVSGRMVTVTVEVTDTRSLPLAAGMRGRVYLRIAEGAPWPARIR
ncbi:HlyD family efflux transporter periplasmic adaptor subunit [Prosthecomicrobium hirschii]|uniref:HlyD family efflux transporter periplasmic adaptor subunit n=1 Tax=Prosthecodimorpha hirschii TaxID=665126 RepID=UPI002220B848|nr:HlyD family efflux transporter periplasmic adaptor subunit [Prosthecomicrobium hirschii]MCW1841150.1 HlyD family efflux transporter periplasmic adaptor subunit [Prosthecomicrobium hirschii]